MAIGSTSSTTVQTNDQAQASTSHLTARRPHEIIEIDSSDEDNKHYNNYHHSIKMLTSVMLVNTSSTAWQTPGAPTSPSAAEPPHDIVGVHSEDDELGCLNRRASETLPVLSTSPIELTDVDESDSEAANLSNRSWFDDVMSISCSDEGTYTFHSESISLTSFS